MLQVYEASLVCWHRYWISLSAMLMISDHMSCFHVLLLCSVSPWVVGVRGAPCDNVMPLSLQNFFIILFWNSLPSVEIRRCSRNSWDWKVLHQLFCYGGAQLLCTLCGDRLCSLPMYGFSSKHRDNFRSPSNRSWLMIGIQVIVVAWLLGLHGL